MREVCGSLRTTKDQTTLLVLGLAENVLTSWNVAAVVPFYSFFLLKLCFLISTQWLSPFCWFGQNQVGHLGSEF